MTTGDPAAGRAADVFAHTAMIVAADHTVRTVLVPALDQLLRSDQPILMIVSDHTAALVRAELRADGDRVQWGDTASFYGGLGSTYERFRRCLAEQHTAGRRVHVVAEPDVTSDTDGTPGVDRAAAYLAYESVCNDTYAPYGCPVTCIWDSRHHPGRIIDDVRRVHTHELTAAGTVPNPAYVPPQAFLAGRNDVPLTDVPPNAGQDLVVADATMLRGLRAALRSSVAAVGFTDPAVDEIVLAVTEIAANGLTHGAAPVRVRVWRHGDTLAVQVDDSGGRPLPADAGYRRPAPSTSPGGRGLWLARQLADTVRTHSRPGNTAVRLHFPPGTTGRRLC